MSQSKIGDDQIVEFNDSSKKKLIDLEDYEKDHYNSLLIQDVKME